MPIISGDKQVINKLRKMADAVAPKSPALRGAFTQIGMRVSGEAIMNATRQGIVDTGSLRSHISYEFFQNGTEQGVRVGVFGVKYAALHEFGGSFTDRMRRAMFASLRRRGKLAPGNAGGRNKGVISGGRFRARPYLIPAFQKNKEWAVQILRSALLQAAKGG